MHRSLLFVVLLICAGMPLHAGAAKSSDAARTAAQSLNPFGPNTFAFEPQPARMIRIVMLPASTNQQCIDELEVYGPGDKTNLALASGGAVASASSCAAGGPYRIAQLNDGLTGDAHAWMAAGETDWAQITLPREATVERIVFSRDRGGRRLDHLPLAFEIRLSRDGQNWVAVRRVEVNALAPVPIAKVLPLETRQPRESLQAWAARIAESVEGTARPAALAQAAKVRTEAEARDLLALARRDRARRILLARLEQQFNPAAIRRAVKDLQATYPDRFKLPEGFEEKLARCEAGLPGLRRLLASAEPAALAEATRRCQELFAFQRAALLANPLLDFDRLLVLRRTLPGGTAHSASSGELGFVPYNFVTQTDIPRLPWDNEITLMTGLRGEPSFERVYKPETGRIVRDLRLDFDGSRLAFSSRGQTGRWSVCEIPTTGAGAPCQLTPTEFPDLDFFDPCYLPSGKMILSSTAGYLGLPCVSGASPTANLYQLDPATKALRQLAFDQDNDLHPTVLSDGRVLYLRWEYSDIEHYFSRRLFTMNPDGTGQLAFYGSGSNFPTTFLFPRPIPGHPTRVVGVLGGHHELSECGRLALLDPALARSYPFRVRPATRDWAPGGSVLDVVPEVLPAEKTGFLQLLPGWGKPVAANVCDGAIANAYSKELPCVAAHPQPLSDKYFLTALKPHPQGLWGIYLVDVFDNMTLIAEAEDAALLEPLPLRATPRPPVIPDRIKPESKTAEVHIADIYSGPGLQGVPRGTVKQLRVFSYHFAYNKTGGHAVVGTQSSWDVKRILGTATVEPDGSAHFMIPANLPVSLQPLDGEGRALQLMRSWLVGMPGERVSCVGCHEDRAGTLAPQRHQADLRPAEPLRPWYGAPRPFAFATEVYPVLEQYCLGCHAGPASAGVRAHPSFKDPQTAYETLHPYVHRPGPESDIAMLAPLEYHASTSPLIQMLEKGHHGRRLAELDREARERLYCWIDLNAPNKGAWDPPGVEQCDQAARRAELAVRFASNDARPEAEYQAALAAFNRRTPIQFIPPAKEETATKDGLHSVPAPPADAERKELDLGGGVKLALARIPAGEFVMGSLEGCPDERPRALTRVERPFWMATTEITNAQYALFDPNHDTRFIDMHGKDHVVPGFIANHPDQPVARVTWQEAMAFCRWLGGKSDLHATLPTEAQWEWAARAGTGTQFFYGSLASDFSPFANLADSSLRWMATSWQGGSILQARLPYPVAANFPLHDERFRDAWHVVNYAGQTRSNPWGLCDMIGNVSEWTRSDYRAYPYRADDGRNSGSERERKVARGGSWADRPVDAGASVRRAYDAWQKVYDVGFRIILED